MVQEEHGGQSVTIPLAFHVGQSEFESVGFTQPKHFQEINGRLAVAIKIAVPECQPEHQSFALGFLGIYGSLSIAEQVSVALRFDFRFAFAFTLRQHEPIQIAKPQPMDERFAIEEQESGSGLRFQEPIPEQVG